MQYKILLPTDFSDNSRSAIAYVLKLYASKACTFYLLNSTKMKISTMSNFSQKLMEIVNDKALKELLNLKAQLANTNVKGNHTFEIILSPKHLDHAIENTVGKYNINLIVIGSKGSTGATEFFFGSNTLKIIRKIRNCPILVIPENHDFVKPLEIAFPTDYNRFYDTNEINPLKNFADLYNSKIRIVHINAEKELNEVQQSNLTILKTYLKNLEYSFHWIPDYNKKTKEINDFIEDLNINVLAMINYRHSFIEKIINEPVIKKIGFQPTVPFLIIPE